MEQKTPKERLVMYGVRGPVAWRSFFARRFRVRSEQSEWLREVIGNAIEKDQKKASKR